MSTLTEIEAAAARLSDDDKRTLVYSLVESLPRPQPRRFTAEQIREWVEQDEREYAELKAEWAREGKSPPAELRP